MTRRGNVLHDWDWGPLVLGLLGCLFSCGCESARFYAQAVHGQVGLLRDREPIVALLEQGDSETQRHETLKLVQEVKGFAEQAMSLAAGGSYETYVHLDRDYVVWNVAVCDEFELRPRSWWYPVVGRLEHRGYFRERSARRYAAQQERRGRDVAVGGVVAYSTLGWFRDPVLSTFLGLSDIELVELVLHELAHTRLFISGDTELNEAFAVSVAESGVMHWLEARGEARRLLDYRRGLANRKTFMALVEELRQTLERTYDEGERSGASLESRRRDKQACIDSFREQFDRRCREVDGLERYRPWVDASMNNATISVLDTYYRWVPQFRALLARSESYSAFYESVRQMKRLSRSERRTALSGQSIEE